MEIAIIILVILAGLFLLALVIGLYVLVAVMAKNRHREVALWLLLSFIASPILIIIILLCIGDDERYIPYNNTMRQPCDKQNMRNATDQTSDNR